MGSDFSPNRHPELVSGSISRFARRQRVEAEADSKVAPVRIARLDEVDFPGSVPVLQLLLASDRGAHIAVHLEPDQPLDEMSSGEAESDLFAMLPQAGFKVGGHADVERAARLAGKDVDAGGALATHRAGSAARWTLKQVQGDGVVLGAIA